MDLKRHQRGLHLVQHVLEGLLDETARDGGSDTGVYLTWLWSAKDAVKNAVATLRRLS